MSQLANKIKPKILKVIHKFPTETTVYREELDSRKQPTEEKLTICDVVGFFHENDSKMGNKMIASIVDKGWIKRPQEIFFMVVIDESTKNIQEGDLLTIRDIVYRITDLGNKNNFDIYYDMGLERQV